MPRRSATPSRAAGRACARARRARSGRVSSAATSCRAASRSRRRRRTARSRRRRSRAARACCQHGAGAGGASASAPRRDSSSVVRSRMSTPSRWSSSCWTTRRVDALLELVELGDDRLSAHAPTLERQPRRFARPARATLCRSRGSPRRRPPSRSSAPMIARVDDRARLVLLVRLEDEQPLEHADLRRREPDAARVVHELRHPLSERCQVVVEVARPRSPACAGPRPGTGGSVQAPAGAEPRLRHARAALRPRESPPQPTSWRV